MHFATTPNLLHRVFPGLLWHVDTDKQVVYLTFDDGPTPNVTNWVLDELDKYQAKATFFCVGKNVALYPDIYQEVLNRGHLTGNHTYTHVNGWNTDDEHYLAEAKRCSQVVDSKYFRPPYGRISWSQIKPLEKNFRIVMWDVLSGDYDINISGEQCVKNVTANAAKGSIIVFHDSAKAYPNLRYALPQVLDYLSSKGFIFACLNKM